MSLEKIREWALAHMPKSRRESHRKYDERLTEWVNSHSWADCLRIDRENDEAANECDGDDYGMDHIDAHEYYDE